MTRDEEAAQCRENIAYYQARLDELLSLPTITQLGRYRMRNGEIVTVTTIRTDAKENEDEVEGEDADEGFLTWDINGRTSLHPEDEDLVEFIGT